MIPFTKAHGNGNDFIIFDAGECPDVIREAHFIQAVCDRHKGIGADGVLVISEANADSVRFKLDYYNCDGSWETFCANGSRCAVAYYLGKTGTQGRITFITGDGKHWAEELPSGLICVQIRAPKYAGEYVGPCGYLGRHVDSGARHFTAEVIELTIALVATDGPRIRHHELFKPKGINANFFKRIDGETLEVITYEKGVESVMLSCASGSVAAAFHASHKAPFTSPLRLINPGGELMLEFDANWEHVSISGPAILVYSSQLPDNIEVK